MKNITLKGQQDVVQTHSIDNTIGGIFNVEIKDLHYAHFSTNITSLEDVDKEEPKLEIRTGYDNELVITRYKGGKLLINGKNINEYNRTQESVQELIDLFKNNRDFFREVTRFVYDDKFINILAGALSRVNLYLRHTCPCCLPDCIRVSARAAPM